MGLALQFILGGSSSGKSYKAYSKIISEAAKDKNAGFFVIVPEQFTMQTQRDLVMMSEKKGISNIDVLSFMRLAYRVFEEVGEPDRLTLEDTGKNMVIRKLLNEKKEELVYYGHARNKQGFTEELKSLITELYQYCVSPEALDKVTEGLSGHPLLRSKLKDVNLIYKSFNEYKKDKYITAEEILDLLCICLEKSDSLKNSVILFDGFTGFTPSQIKVLRILFSMAKDVLVTVTIDPKVNLSSVGEFDLFALSAKTIRTLLKVAEEEHIKVAPDFITDYPLKNAEIAALRENIFRYPYAKYEKKPESIRIKKEYNRGSEVAFVMNEAEHLIRDEGYRFRDIAFITGDMSRYADEIEKEAKKRGILVFIDRKKDILKNPLVELIRAAIAVIDEDFAYEPVMRYLRSGFAAPDTDSIDLFENFIIKTGLRGRNSYLKEWTKCDPCVNDVRKYVAESFEDLCEVLSSKESLAGDMARGIYDFLCLHDAENILADMQADFEKEGELLLAKEYGQVYRLVLSVFEKMSELMGDEKIDLDEFSDLVESGFNEEDVGLIPPGMDCIVVGDLNRTRIKGIKALFVLGVNEGIIPASGTKAGILSDSDKEKISAFDVELAPGLRERQITEQFYIYMNLTKPTQRLYLTYSLAGSDGAALRPSYVIPKIKKIFTGLIEEEPDIAGNDILREIRKDKGLDYVFSGLLEDVTSDDFYALLKYHLTKGSDDPAFKAALEGFESKRNDAPLSEAVSRELYKEMKGSVSRLEKYSSCAFAHFLTYGLGLNERKTSEIAAPDLGQIYHEIIAKFSSAVKGSEEGFAGITDEQCKELATDISGKVIESYNEGIFGTSARLLAMTEQIKDIAVVTALKVVEQVRAGAFDPSEFEQSFDADGLKGTIDRIDTAEDEDKKYIRIIDYKSSEKKFDITEFYYGLNIQLALYLNAVLKSEAKKDPEKEVVPSGMFYYTFKNPLVESEDKLAGEFKMNGAVNKSIDSVEVNDRALGECLKNHESYTSTVINAKLQKNGNFVGDLYSREILTGIANKAEEKAEEVLKGIRDGKIEIDPYAIGDKEACQYCKFNGICGFETRTGKYSYRKLEKLKPEQIEEIYGGGQ